MCDLLIPAIIGVAALGLLGGGIGGNQNATVTIPQEVGQVTHGAPAYAAPQQYAYAAPQAGPAYYPQPQPAPAYYNPAPGYAAQQGGFGANIGGPNGVGAGVSAGDAGVGVGANVGGLGAGVNLGPTSY